MTPDYRRPIWSSVGAGALACAVLLLVSGCAPKDVMASADSGDTTNSGRRVADIDWTKAEIVDVELSEYEFTPSSLVFQHDRPYRLRLINRGRRTHDFASSRFFQAIATAKLVEGNKTIDLPRLKSIGIGAGQTTNLYFVPVRVGTYRFECEEPLHSLFEMVGEAQID